MRISIIVPLFDRRSTGWKALESALAQTMDRARYDVVAVVGRSTDTDAHLAQLLLRCDTVVPIDADAGIAGNEIHFYIAGERAAKGDVLFFVEGHTELLPGCCVDIDAYFRRHPDSAVAWAPRVNVNRTPLGAIIGRINLRAESVAESRGWFSLGANCVITKSLFDELGGFYPGYFRTNENAIFERLRERRIPIGRIESALVRHDNDIPRRLLVDAALVAGSGKFNWWTSEQAAGNVDGTAVRRYRLYRRVSHPLTARMLDPVFMALGHASLFLATGAARVSLPVACALYLVAQRSFSASGFCRARLASAGLSPSDIPRSSGDAATPTRRAVLGAALSSLVLAGPTVLRAQPKSRTWRIGFLASDSSSSRAHEGFRQGMRELGLVEGQNFVVDWRFADGNYARLPAMAAELARQNVDIIVASTTSSVQAARKATTTIPIVMVAVPDPVGEGFATSLSRPGGNITGLSSIVTEVSVKHVELLHAAVPGLSRVAILINPLNPSDALILEQVEGAAYTRKLKVVTVEASTANQIDAAFAAIARARAEALIVAADSFFEVQHEQIIKLAVGNRLPTISSNREMTEAGCLMSYGQDLSEHYRRAATYVEKILKGAKPGNLPVEQPTVLEFVVNVRTAKAIGLAIPRSVLLRADKLIE